MLQSIQCFWKMKEEGVISLLCLLFLLASIPSLIAQSPDSYLDQRREATVMEWEDVEGAIVYWLQEYEGDRAKNDPRYQAEVCLILSKAYNVRRNIEEIELWNRRASDLYEKLGDPRGQAEVLYQKGFAEFCRREYEEAMESVLEGISIMESLDDEEGIGLGYLRMSRLFHFTSKMSKSAEYGKKGGEKLESVGAIIEAADSWSFAGHGYRMMKDSSNAAMAFNRSLTLAEESGIPNVLSMAYNDLASFYMEFDLFKDAEKYFLRALEIADSKDERSMMVIKNGLSQIYLHTERFDQCIAITREALATVHKTNDIFFLTELPEYMAKSYEGLQQYDSAYKYMKLNWIYTDSLFTINQEEALQEMQTKYETEKKERIISRQRREQLFGGALLIALGGIVLLLIRAYRSKNKINAVLEERNKEKDFLLKEIHHRVKNNLQILSSLLSLQSNNEEDSTVLSALQESRNRVESMGLIHQKLYTKDNPTSVNLKEYIQELCDYLTDSFNSEEIFFTIIPEIQVGLADVETAIPLGLIINELITNSMKYAFDGTQKGIVEVKLQEEGDKLILQVTDNGNGSIAETGSGTNFGSQLIQILSKKLKGVITVNQEEGFQTTIVFSRYKLT